MMPCTLIKLAFVALTAAQLLTVAPTSARAQAAAPGTFISPTDDAIYPKVAAHVLARSLPAPSRFPPHRVGAAAAALLVYGSRFLAASNVVEQGQLRDALTELRTKAMTLSMESDRASGSP